MKKNTGIVPNNNQLVCLTTWAEKNPRLATETPDEYLARYEAVRIALMGPFGQCAQYIMAHSIRSFFLERITSASPSPFNDTEYAAANLSLNAAASALAGGDYSRIEEVVMWCAVSIHHRERLRIEEEAAAEKAAKVDKIISEVANGDVKPFPQ